MSRKINPFELVPFEFLNLIYFFILSEINLEEKDRKKFINQVNGPLRTIGKRDENVSYMPSWWRGDEKATQMSTAARMVLRH